MLAAAAFDGPAGESTSPGNSSTAAGHHQPGLVSAGACTPVIAFTAAPLVQYPCCKQTTLHSGQFACSCQLADYARWVSRLYRARKQVTAHHIAASTLTAESVRASCHASALTLVYFPCCLCDAAVSAASGQVLDQGGKSELESRWLYQAA